MWTQQRYLAGLRPIWLVGLLLLGNELTSVSGALEIDVVSPSSGVWTASKDVGFDIGVTDPSQAYAFIDWQDSLLGWWRGEGDATDSSVTANTATVVGDVTYGTGKFGSCFLFGSGGKLTIPDNDAYGLGKNDSWTFSFWIKPVSNTQYVSFNKGSDFRFGRYTVQWRIGFGNGYVNYDDYSDPSGTWIHFLVVYNGSTHGLTWYANGASCGSTTVTNWGTFPDRTDLVFAGAGGLEGGGLDEILWFNRVLSATEIAALYNATAARLQTTCADLTEMTPYSYTVHAVNAAGEHASQSGQVTVDVPNSAPTGTITTLTSPMRSSSSSQTFTAAVQDTNGDTTLATATLYWDYGQPFGPTAYTGSLSGDSDTVSIPASGLSLGPITWNLYVEDSGRHGGFIAPNQTLLIGRTDYFVAPGGSDSADGTIDHPFATIQHFADLAYPGDTCYLRAGTYRETVTPARSGTASAPITFEAYPGETATVSGADPVASGWQVHSGTIYKTTAMSWDLGKGLNQVFVDDVAMIEARWPNTTDIMKPGLAAIDGGSAMNGSTLTLNDADLTQATNYWVGAIVHGIWGTRYHAGTAQVTASANGTLTATMDCSNRGNPSTVGEYYLVGLLSELDSAGEFFYDSSTSTLYLWAPNNGSPTNVEAKARATAFNCNGRSYIHLQNLHIFAANITTDEDSDHLLLDGLNVEYVSHYTLIDEGDMGEGQKGTRDTGIILDGSYNTLQNSTINYSAGNGVSLIGDNCTVTHCTITKCNYVVTECANVGCGLTPTKNNVITYNTLHYAGRCNINHTAAENLTVAYNDMAYTRQGWEAWDLGATYCIATDGKGSTIAYNRIHDIRSIGIYLDNANWNFNIHHNLVWTISGTAKPIGLLMNMPSENHRVFNNTFVDSIVQSGFSGGAAGTQVRNNICSEMSNIVASGGQASNNILTKTNSINPLFVDTNNHDFRLQANSPAVNAGIDVGFTQDLLGNPIGDVPDIGAYESTSTSTTYTLNIAAANGSVTRSPDKEAYNPWETVTLQVLAGSGYTFTGWSGSLAGTSSSTILTMNADDTVTANFIANAYTLSVAGMNGSVSTDPPEATYEYAETVTLQAMPNTGYHFTSWSGDLSGSANPTILVMNSNRSVVAGFAINTYSLNTTALNGSVVRSPERASYTHGETVSLQAVPAAGYEFAGWSGVLNGDVNPATVVMDSNKSVTANFTDRPPDSQPPRVTSCLPEPDAIQAPLNSLVTLHVSDDGWGVDANTVTVSVDGAVVYTGNVPSYSSALGVCRRIGSQADYTYAYQSNKDFDCDQRIVVTVDAADLKGNVMPQHSYSFTTNMRAFGPNLKASSALGSLGKGSPATVHDSAGDIWVVWHAGATGQRDIYVSKLAHGSDSFGDAVQLTMGAGDECNPDMAIDTDNKLYVVWQDNRRGNWDVYARTSVDGVTWSGERRIADSNDNQVNPAIVVDAQSPHRAYIAWQDDGTGNQDIYVASSNDGFATKTISRVTSDTSDQTDPKMAADSSNTVYLVWTDRRNGSDDIYGASSGTGPWTNVPLVTGAGNQNSPVIATEVAGSVLDVVWVDDASGNQDIRYASANGLPLNPLTGMSLIDDTTGADRRSPAVATVGSAGNGLKVFVCWRDERNIKANGGDADLYLVEVRAGAETNILIDDEGARSDQSEPVMGIDGYGYPYVVWTDDRNTAADIYYSGSTFMEPNALTFQLVSASAGGTVGTVPPISVDDVSVVIPAGACPLDATVTITPIQNLRGGAVSHVIAYDFGPSGLQFGLPVTIMIPYAVAEFGADLPGPYWYDSQTGALSRQGITNVETLYISSSIYAIRFRTTHFTPYVLLPASAGGNGGVGAGGGGGGGGGCSLSAYGESDPYGYCAPFVILAIVMGILRLRGSARCSTSHRYPGRGRT